MFNENLSKASSLRDFWEANIEELSLIDPDLYGRGALNTVRDKITDFECQYSNLKQNGKKLKVCVGGNFNAGKSTFINSLISEDLLGREGLPSTAKVTSLSYGDEYRFFKCTFGKDRIPFSREEFNACTLVNKDKIQECGDVHHFEIELPCKILKNIIIYDTPGYSTADGETDDRLTDDQINQSDFLIWVSIAQKGIHDDELKKLNSFTIPVVCIANRMDQVPPSNKSKVLKYFEEVGRINEKKFGILPYAAKPILKTAVSEKLQKENIENIMDVIKNSIINKNQQALTIEDGVVYAGDKNNGVLYKVEHISDSEFDKYEKDMLCYLERKLKTKESRSRIFENSLNKDLEKYNKEIVGMLNDSIKKSDNTKAILTDAMKSLRSQWMNEEKCRVQRISKRYSNLKTVLIRNCKYDMVSLVEAGFFRSTNNVSVSFLSESMLKDFNDQLKIFAKDMLQAFKDEYQLDTDLNPLTTSFLKDTTKVIGLLKHIFDSGLFDSAWKASSFDEDQIESVNEKFIDLIIPDESYYSYLKYFFAKTSQLTHESDIQVIKCRLDKLTAFRNTTKELLKSYKTDQNITSTNVGTNPEILDRKHIEIPNKKQSIDNEPIIEAKLDYVKTIKDVVLTAIKSKDEYNCTSNDTDVEVTMPKQKKLRTKKSTD